MGSGRVAAVTRLARGAAVIGALVAGGGGVGVAGARAGAAVAARAGAAVVPARDQFNGHVTSATGRYRSDRGRVSIQVSVAATFRTTRRITLSIHGASCGTTHHCLTLSARLSGSVTRRPATIPDIGASDSLRLAGGVAPLGQTSARGTIEGTGMIGRGRETMTLTLTSGRGTLTIQATSPVVPGFAVV
jgi:hypothetical protein